MPYISDEDLLALAIRELPKVLHERLQKTRARVLRCGQTPPVAPELQVANKLDEKEPDKDQEAGLLSELEKMLEIKIESSSPDDSADIEYLEQTELGTRATVVQIRDGKVKRVISQA